MNKCIICKEDEGSLVNVTERGLDGLMKYSVERKEDEITNELKHCKKEKISVFVHENCRKWFNNKRRIGHEPQKIKKTRLSLEQFHWKSNCFYCGTECIADRKNKNRKDWHLASTFETKETILKKCDSKLDVNPDDRQALDVKARLEDCYDLIAAEARYHQSCSTKFRVNDSSTSKANQSGRKPDNILQNSFSKSCEWLEMETDLVTVKDFQDKMVQLSENDNSYTTKHIKNLLKEKYGSYVFFSDASRETKNVICFQDMASYIINKRLNDKKGDTKDETESIIKAAADLIKSEIRF